MGMAAPLYYTAEMVRQMPDDGSRYEVVYGELLVTPAPRRTHQLVLGNLYEPLRAWLRREPVGVALFAPADVSWGEDTLVQPDLLVTTLDEFRAPDSEPLRTLLLAVEILSPSSTRADRFTKRRLYQAQRVAMYWVVDIERQVVEVWTPDVSFPSFERERLVWHPAGATEPFILSCAELFRPV
jgi:Uma2 family endonuclease